MIAHNFFYLNSIQLAEILEKNLFDSTNYYRYKYITIFKPFKSSAGPCIFLFVLFLSDPWSQKWDTPIQSVSMTGVLIPRTDHACRFKNP